MNKIYAYYVVSKYDDAGDMSAYICTLKELKEQGLNPEDKEQKLEFYDLYIDGFDTLPEAEKFKDEALSK